MNEAARLRPDRFGEVRSCPPEGPPRTDINNSYGAIIQSLFAAVSARDKSGHQPSIAAISEALPPAAVVSMQVTRSVAKRAT